MSHGVIGFYSDPNEIIDAVKEVKKKGYDKIDTFSPFPIHGMDDAMGLGRSWLPFVTLLMGTTGALSAFIFQSWTSGAIDLWPAWPLIIAGKPFWSIPAFIPITFEWTVLFGGHATALTMIAINGLPNLGNPLLNPKFASKITNDQLALVIFSKDPRYNAVECLELLKSLGAKDVEEIPEDYE